MPLESISAARAGASISRLPAKAVQGRMEGDMEQADELPNYAVNDPRELIRFLQDAYRQRKDVVIRADDCRYLADALQERLNSADYSGPTLL